jgi:hypothetical protein
LPQQFSEPFVSYLAGLVHNPKTGPDAFELSASDEVTAVVEIKATITDVGFTDLKRDLAFDVLYWLSMERYSDLQYSLYRVDKETLSNLTIDSRTPRERATVGLRKLFHELGVKPVTTGRIGIVPDDTSGSDVTPSRPLQPPPARGE